MKLEDIKIYYENKMEGMQQKLDLFQRQLLIFEKLCDDGNMFI